MADWPYNTQRWQRLRKLKLSTDPLCDQCKTEGRTVAARHVDHMQAIAKGGDVWALDNLRSLCHSCHSQKTMHVDQLGRDTIPVKGCDASGLPRDPNHWWNKH